MANSRARAAGRGLVRGLGSTGLAAAGGATYYGVHAVTTPSLYGTESSNIPKRFWWIPVAGIVLGHGLSRVQKLAPAGYGFVGGATAIGVEQTQMAMSIKKNSALQPAPAGTGSLLMPGDVDAGALLSAREVEAGYSEAGFIAGAPDRRAYSSTNEAAGLSL